MLENCQKLLNNIAKLYTKILQVKLYKIIPFLEEQHEFLRNRSAIDALFIIIQLVEKSLES